MQGTGIAIVGCAARYGGAASADELWQNVLAQRKAFRRMPRERLRLADFLSGAQPEPDSIELTYASVLKDYEFDRGRFHVPGSSFRVADMAHWLALEVAAEALADAGFENGDGLPRGETGVIVGNTLTGEFSRANLMRLRWPYVRRQVGAALAARGWDGETLAPFLAELEAAYKQPFPATTDESLAGGLSNTIAGRIVNHFDLQGGGFTVDGACSSSLLAVAQACSALAVGDVAVAVVGGVDLSLDPFELVGFSRTGALAKGEMRVFDQEPTGFIPGEGCGFVVLMPLAAAIAGGRRVLAVIRGWGVSSDGGGGLTRPETAGQLLAMERAYRRAGFGPDSVALFEAHGTGTAVGDATELATLQEARRQAGATERAVVSSIKAQIGHTKAASGVAGLIKACFALRDQILPPTPGCRTPHATLASPGALLRVLGEPEPWPAAAPLRAGVSSMGFGGINCHVALESPAQARRKGFVAEQRALAAAPQDAELFCFGGADPAALASSLREHAERAAALSFAELTDLAVELLTRLRRHAIPFAHRVAIVAASPGELAERLLVAADRLSGRTAADDAGARAVFLGAGFTAPRIALLFPGQATSPSLDGGGWRRRFPELAGFWRDAELPAHGDVRDTAVAQPAIVAASLAGLAVLDRLGVTAVAAAGHSLGELVALTWAGSLDERALQRLARARGRAMADAGDGDGAMASLGAPVAVVAEIAGAGLAAGDLAIAADNGPRQTVVAGRLGAVEAAVRLCQARGLRASVLPVTRAFHSPLVAASEAAIATALAAEGIVPPSLPVASTISGAWLTADESVRDLLLHQITSPVCFAAAVRHLAEVADVLVEVGPGRVLSGLAGELCALPAYALDAGGQGLAGLLTTTAALWAAGAPLDLGLLADRFARPIDPLAVPSFLVNPCELAPLDDSLADHPLSAPVAAKVAPRPIATPASTPAARSELPLAAGSPRPLEVVRHLISRRMELPVESIRDESRLLSDLHLSSIAVGDLVMEAARQLELPPPLNPTELANLNVGQLAKTLAELAQAGSVPAADAIVEGLDTWVRGFTVAWDEAPLGKPHQPPPTRWSVHGGDAGRGSALGRCLAALSSLPEAAAGTFAVAAIVRGERADLDLLLAAAKESQQPGRGLFLLLRPADGADGSAAFARTLALESPELAVVVLHLPAEVFDADETAVAPWVDRVLAECRVVRRFAEARLDADGSRLVRAVDPLPEAPETTAMPLAKDELLLATGGGKGIGAECALTLAKATGARLAIFGRSSPEADPELARNLERMAAQGVELVYLAADLQDREAVRQALATLPASWGPVRGLLHSAGVNTPTLIAGLERREIDATLGPKVDGLLHLLAELDPGALRLLVAFGSIIGLAGLVGEAHYALANEELRHVVETFAGRQPDCRCLCLEWSVWAGVGMGARIADLEALQRQGMTPISIDDGLALLTAMLCRPTPTAVLACGRFADLPTLALRRPELPLWRFLESPRVYVPGVELVVDTELAFATDPYLEDHLYEGDALFPAVLGLEAMAQAALALRGRHQVSGLRFRDVRFNRPIVAAPDHATTLRVVALARGADRVEVALRVSTSQFKVDCFRGIVELGPLAESPADGAAESPRLALEPDELYGRVLFQSGRFRRLSGYRHLRATACVADVTVEASPSRPGRWFGSLLPAELLLGDPGARDASIHAVQACIPHATVLPVALASLTIGPGARAAGSLRRVVAHEVSRHGRSMIFDIETRTEDGELVDLWQGLELTAPHGAERMPELALPLVAPYLERRLGDLLPAAGLLVGIAGNASSSNGSSSNGHGHAGNGNGSRPDRAALGTAALAQALGRPVTLDHRPDGKPEARATAGAGGEASALAVSLAHAATFTFGIVGQDTLGCDVEAVTSRDEAAWARLLGPRWELFETLTKATGEDRDSLATRLWTLGESLRKAGLLAAAPLVFEGATGDGWLTFSAGRYFVGSVLVQLAAGGERLAFAVLAEGIAAVPAS